MQALRALYAWWKPIARKIGDVQARVLLTLFYFVVLGPFALAVSIFSDPLAVKPTTTPGWRPRPPKSHSLTDATRQS